MPPALPICPELAEFLFGNGLPKSKFRQVWFRRARDDGFLQGAVIVVTHQRDLNLFGLAVFLDFRARLPFVFLQSQGVLLPGLSELLVHLCRNCNGGQQHEWRCEQQIPGEALVIW